MRRVVVHGQTAGKTRYDPTELWRSVEWRHRRGALVALIFIVGLLPVHGVSYAPAGPRPDAAMMRWVDGPAQLNWHSILLSGFADIGIAADPEFGASQQSISIPGCCERYSLAWLPTFGILVVEGWSAVWLSTPDTRSECEPVCRRTLIQYQSDGRSYGEWLP